MILCPVCKVVPYALEGQSVLGCRCNLLVYGLSWRFGNSSCGYVLARRGEDGAVTSLEHLPPIDSVRRKTRGGPRLKHVLSAEELPDVVRTIIVESVLRA